MVCIDNEKIMKMEILIKKASKFNGKILFKIRSLETTKVELEIFSLSFFFSGWRMEEFYYKTENTYDSESYNFVVISNTH
jgi:hypothetical protein